MTPGKKKAHSRNRVSQVSNPRKSEMHSQSTTISCDQVAPINGADIFEGLFEPEPFWFWHCLSGTPETGLNRSATWPEVLGLLGAEPPADQGWTMAQWAAEKARAMGEQRTIKEQFRRRFNDLKGLPTDDPRRTEVWAEYQAALAPAKKALAAMLQAKASRGAVILSKMAGSGERNEGGPYRSSRTIESVERVYGLTIDQEGGRPVTAEEILAVLEGKEALVTPTRSWRPEAPRHRVTLPYARPLTLEEHYRVTGYWLDRLQAAGVQTDRGASAGPATLAFLPTRNADQPWRPVHQQGDPLDPSDVPEDYRPPAQDRVVPAGEIPVPEYREPDLEALGVSEATRALAINGEGIEGWEDQTGSGVAYAAAVALLREGVSDADILRALATPEWAAGAKSYKERGDNDASRMAWARYTLARAKLDPRAVPAPSVSEMFGKVEGAVQPPTPKRKLVFLRVHELLEQPHPEWLVRGVIPTKGFGVVYGPSGSGKTFVMLDLCFAVATGQPWHGNRVKDRGGAVCYISAEGALRNRVSAYLLTKPHLEPPQNFRLLQSSVNLFDPSADVQPLIEALDEFREELGSISLVVVDTLNRAMPGGNENSSEDMGRMIQVGDLFAARYGCAWTYVHHAGKNEAAGARGHSSLKAACDFELEVSTTHGGLRLVRASKVKDGEERDLLAFHLRSVTVGADDEGKPITSCVLDPVADPKAATRKQKTPTGYAKEMLDVLKTLVDREGILLKATKEDFQGAKHRPDSGTKGVLARRLREEAKKWFSDAENVPGNVPEGEEKKRANTLKMRLDRGVKDLQADDFIVKYGDWVWLSPER